MLNLQHFNLINEENWALEKKKDLLWRWWFKEISNEEKSERNMINWNSIIETIFHRQRAFLTGTLKVTCNFFYYIEWKRKMLMQCPYQTFYIVAKWCFFIPQIMIWKEIIKKLLVKNGSNAWFNISRNVISESDLVVFFLTH